MAETLTFELVTPLGVHQGEKVKDVVVPAASGEMDILPGHDVMIVQLGAGALTIHYEDGRTDHFFAAYGYVEIEKDHLRVLAEILEEKSKIDLDRAKDGKARAEKRLADFENEIDYNRAARSLKRCEERIRVATEL